MNACHLYPALRDLDAELSECVRDLSKLIPPPGTGLLLPDVVAEAVERLKRAETILGELMTRVANDSRAAAARPVYSRN